MEKIQKAIQKARQVRDGQASDLAVTSSPVTSVPKPSAVPTPEAAPLAPSGVDAAWNALPQLGVSAATLIKHRIMTLEHGKAATAFDVMRTKTAQAMRANGWKRLAITSPTPACGKTTLALNLAFSFARQPEIRTILCEMDLRRPQLGALLSHEPKHGIERVLQGKVDFADQAIRHDTNLAISLCKNPARNAAEMLQSEMIAPLLSDLETRYDPDIMIFDMPPMLANDDMMAFATHVDCVLIIAAAESTTIKQIDLCERELATQTNMLGVVLNKCRYVEDDHSYNYYA